jgi:valyl-tRNA synthetase
LFRPLALTKTYSMAAAAGLSVTLIPVLMIMLIKGRIRPEHHNPINRWLIRTYRPALARVLARPKFVLGIEAPPGEIAEPLDLAMLAALRDVVRGATAAFDDYEHARALDLVERFFWGFTDDYLELVKQRAYGVHGQEAAGSAVAALRLALDVLQRLFAPFLSYVTEEVWSWWREGSVHRAAWPRPEELAIADGADPGVYEVAAEVLTAIRKEKALAKVSLRVPAERVTVRDTAERIARLALAEVDVREAGNVQALATETADAASVEVVLAPPEPA